MPKLAANLTLLFNELDFIDRFAAAALAGFRGVEYLFPYAFPKNQLADRLAENGLVQVLHNLPPGDWDAGERGIACHPDRVGEFQDGVGLAIEYASTLGCRQLNCLAGLVPPKVDADRVRDTFIRNLRFAADALNSHGIRLLVEAINTFDMPGFYASRSAQTLEFIDAAGHPNIYFQYDIYHMQRMEGELATTIKRLLPRIAHFQLADNPGRHEPGSGEINYPFLLQWIDDAGYDGWVGCEYRPEKTTGEGLGWAAPWLTA